MDQISFLCGSPTVLAYCEMSSSSGIDTSFIASPVWNVYRFFGMMLCENYLWSDVRPRSRKEEKPNACLFRDFTFRLIYQ
ncbi:hypothetical protein F9L69_05360 [Brucella melitensis]|uniref:Uncharacterized protein n=8 Tax=Brucella TaxID=234 RepID=A0AAI8H7F5_BRUSS|nr:hypothetical protein BMEI0255 [Brucella melitensis bv. 1 str. 16M]APY15015.1 hypothetical protein BKD02_07300 [Brucella sp. 09RB8910]AQQ57537.1 hypothetical protein ADS42_002575 [Brucella melitensis]ATN21433.1 hypothetical protein CRN66_13690 [Brucella canis]ATQ53175.1 hypothetical protein CS875_08875 [Brucella suis]EEX88145.1 predicted protein [Brucella ceti B1/94]EEY05299.1 predicted protein [Brucella neotomae 5K33]EEY25419.1 predicted protein [Brucella sp. F5/99]EEZ09325.1 predicted p